MALSSRVVACYLNANKGVSESKIRQKLKGCNGSTTAIAHQNEPGSVNWRIAEVMSERPLTSARSGGFLLLDQLPPDVVQSNQ